MSSFLNLNQLNQLTGIFNRHFDTFSSGINNYITVLKEPTKIINNTNSLNMPGYSNDSLNLSDITYIPVSGVFPAMIIYPKDAKIQSFTQLNLNLDKNDIAIKVKEDCKNYIINGKTENIIVNNNLYNSNDTPVIQNFFGSKYYYFKLTATR